MVYEFFMNRAKQIFENQGLLSDNKKKDKKDTSKLIMKSFGYVRNDGYAHIF
jgi:hypothetical protein